MINWASEDQKEVMDAFLRFHKIINFLKKFIEDGRATLKKEKNKKQTKRRTELIASYIKKIDVSILCYEDFENLIPNNIEKLRTPFEPLNPLIPPSEYNKDEREVKMSILLYGEAFWLKRIIFANEAVMLLLSHPLGKWGAKYEFAESSGRAGGKKSSKYKPAIAALVYEIKTKTKWQENPTQRNLWSLAEAYSSYKSFEFNDCEVYRDGERLIHIDRNGKESSIGFDALRKSYPRVKTLGK